MRILTPFEMRMTIYRRQKRALKGARIINTRAQLEKHLKVADILINALPLNENTQGFVSASLLAKLKGGAVLVNVGRGATMDEAAAIKRLKAGKIRALILDVTQREPIKRSSRYWRTPGLFLTQHTAGGHKDELRMKCRFFVENLKRYMNRKPLLNMVH
jgi:phosphoglycerate dehydrogenase-like enzyme